MILESLLYIFQKQILDQVKDLAKITAEIKSEFHMLNVISLYGKYIKVTLRCFR
jgi:hypothetical protein